RPDEFPATGRVSMTPKISFLARPAVFALVLVALLWPFPAIGGPMSHVGDELLVRFRAGAPSTYHSALHAAVGSLPHRAFRDDLPVPPVRDPPRPSPGEAPTGAVDPPGDPPLAQDPRRAVRRADPRGDAAGRAERSALHRR